MQCSTISENSPRLRLVCEILREGGTPKITGLDFRFGETHIQVAGIDIKDCKAVRALFLVSLGALSRGRAYCLSGGIAKNLRDAARADRPPKWALAFFGKQANGEAWITDLIKAKRLNHGDGPEQAIASLNLDVIDLDHIELYCNGELRSDDLELVGRLMAAVETGRAFLSYIENEENRPGRGVLKIGGTCLQDFSAAQLSIVLDYVEKETGERPEVIDKQDGCVELTVELPDCKLELLLAAIRDKKFAHLQITEAWREFPRPDHPTLSGFNQDIVACNSLVEQFSVLRSYLRSLIHTDGSVIYEETLEPTSFQLACDLLRALLDDPCLAASAKQIRAIRLFGAPCDRRWKFTDGELSVFPGNIDDLGPGGAHFVMRSLFASTTHPPTVPLNEHPFEFRWSNRPDSPNYRIATLRAQPHFVGKFEEMHSPKLTLRLDDHVCAVAHLTFADDVVLKLLSETHATHRVETVGMLTGGPVMHIGGLLAGGFDALARIVVEDDWRNLNVGSRRCRIRATRNRMRRNARSRSFLPLEAHEDRTLLCCVQDVNDSVILNLADRCIDGMSFAIDLKWSPREICGMGSDSSAGIEHYLRWGCVEHSFSVVHVENCHLIPAEFVNQFHDEQPKDNKKFVMKELSANVHAECVIDCPAFVNWATPFDWEGQLAFNAFAKTRATDPVSFIFDSVSSGRNVTLDNRDGPLNLLADGGVGDAALFVIETRPGSVIGEVQLAEQERHVAIVQLGLVPSSVRPKPIFACQAAVVDDLPRTLADSVRNAIAALTFAPREAMATSRSSLVYGSVAGYFTTVTSYPSYATKRWVNHVYLSSDEKWDANDLLILPNPASRSELPYTRSETVPLRGGIDGEFCVKADGNISVNDYGQLFEHGHERNNVRTSDTPFILLSSSKGYRVVLPEVEAVGDTGSGKNEMVHWTVRNAGAGPTLVNDWSDRIFLSQNDYILSDDLMLGTVSRNNLLDAGASYSPSLEVAPPVNAFGTHRNFVVADAEPADGGRVRDFETEQDNVRAAQPIVIAAFLTPAQGVIHIDAPAELFSVVNFPFTRDVENQGDAAVPDDSWRDSIWLSRENQQGDPHGVLQKLSRQQGGLAAHASCPRIELRRLPENPSRDPQLIVYVDDVVIRTAYGEVDEGSTGASDNVVLDDQVLQVTLSGRADLEVTEVEVSTAIHGERIFCASWVLRKQGDAELGSPFGLDISKHWEVENIGTGETILDRRFDSTCLSNRLFGTGYSLGRFLHDGALKHNEGYVDIETVRWPRHIQDRCYFTFETDTQNQVFEFTFDAIDHPPNMGGNSLKSSEPIDVILHLPTDREEIDMTEPSSAIGGDVITVTWSVDNCGNGPMKVAQWQDHVYLSADDVWDPGTPPIRAFAHNGAIEVRQQFDSLKSLAITLPDNADGNYLIVYIDGNNRDLEAITVCDEPRVNTFLDLPCAVTLLSLPKPAEFDLELINPRIPSNGFSSTELLVEWDMQNHDPDVVKQSHFAWSDTICFSTDPALSQNNWTLASKATFGPLAMGDTYPMRLPLVVPAAISGLYYLLAVADAGGHLAESDESNNTLVQPLLASYTEPDLQFDGMDVTPWQVASGRQLLVNWSVTNVANRKTTLEDWAGIVYLSQHDTISLFDIAVPAQRNGKLDIGESCAVSAQIAVPTDAAAPHYVLLAVDGRRVPEFPQAYNNFGKTAVDVTLNDDIGHTVLSVDAMRRLTRTEYNALAWPAKFTEPTVTVDVSVTRYEYDEDGNLTRKTNALGRENNCEYTSLNLPKKRLASDSELGGSDDYPIWTLTRDKTGNLSVEIKQYDALGRVTDVTYDYMSQLLQRVDPDAGRALSNEVRSGIFSHEFEVDGCACSNERMTDYCPRHYHQRPTLYVLPSDDYLTIWKQDGELLGQRFLATGQPTGGQFHVNAYGTWRQDEQPVAKDSRGNATIVNDRELQNGSACSVHAPRFARTVSERVHEVIADSLHHSICDISREFPVEARPTVNGTFRSGHSSVTVCRQGSAVWVSYDLECALYVGSLGRSLGESFIVTSGTSAHSSARLAGDKSENLTCRVASDGIVLEPRLDVNAETSMLFILPNVSIRADGVMVVICNEIVDGGEGSASFDQPLVPDTSPFHVGSDICGRRLMSSGWPIGERHRETLKQLGERHVGYSSFAADTRDLSICAWQENHTGKIGVRRFSRPDGEDHAFDNEVVEVGTNVPVSVVVSDSTLDYWLCAGAGVKAQCLSPTFNVKALMDAASTDGTTSLREAIIEANNDLAFNLICLPDGYCKLTGTLLGARKGDVAILRQGTGHSQSIEVVDLNRDAAQSVIVDAWSGIRNNLRYSLIMFSLDTSVAIENVAFKAGKFTSYGGLIHNQERLAVSDAVFACNKSCEDEFTMCSGLCLEPGVKVDGISLVSDGSFFRGDTNDNGDVDLADLTVVHSQLVFAGSIAPVGTSDDLQMDLTEVSNISSYTGGDTIEYGDEQRSTLENHKAVGGGVDSINHTAANVMVGTGARFTCALVSDDVQLPQAHGGGANQRWVAVSIKDEFAKNVGARNRASMPALIAGWIRGDEMTSEQRRASTASLLVALIVDGMQCVAHVSQIALATEAILIITCWDTHSEWKWIALDWNLRMIDHRPIVLRNGCYQSINGDFGTAQCIALADYLARESNDKLRILVKDGRGQWSAI